MKINSLSVGENSQLHTKFQISNGAQRRCWEHVYHHSKENFMNRPLISGIRKSRPSEGDAGTERVIIEISAKKNYSFSRKLLIVQNSQISSCSGTKLKTIKEPENHVKCCEI